MSSKPTKRGAASAPPPDVQIEDDVVEAPIDDEPDEPTLQLVEEFTVEPDPELPDLSTTPAQNTVVDPPPAAAVEPPTSATRRVRALRNENVPVGEEHYTLQAGSTLELPSAVADALLARRMVAEV